MDHRVQDLLVSVKPFGHFHSRLNGITMGHREVDINPNVTNPSPAIKGGHSSNKECGCPRPDHSVRRCYWESAYAIC